MARGLLHHGVPVPMSLTDGAISRCCAGEHEHTIIGYSLVKGIGDGEPIASERFTVGGHEWVSSCTVVAHELPWRPERSCR